MKVDQGILPDVDYLHINLFERSGVLILLNPFTGIQQGGKWKDICLVNVVLGGQSHIVMSVIIVYKQKF